MTTPTTIPKTLGQLNAQLEQQAAEIRRIHGILNIQFKRIAHMQAELDVLPTARERRRTIRALLEPPRSNGNVATQRNRVATPQRQAASGRSK